MNNPGGFPLAGKCLKVKGEQPKHISYFGRGQWEAHRKAQRPPTPFASDREGKS